MGLACYHCVIERVSLLLILSFMHSQYLRTTSVRAPSSLLSRIHCPTHLRSPLDWAAAGTLCSRIIDLVMANIKEFIVVLHLLKGVIQHATSRFAPMGLTPMIEQGARGIQEDLRAASCSGLFPRNVAFAYRSGVLFRLALEKY